MCTTTPGRQVSSEPSVSPVSRVSGVFSLQGARCLQSLECPVSSVSRVSGTLSLQGPRCLQCQGARYLQSPGCQVSSVFKISGVFSPQVSGVYSPQGGRDLQYPGCQVPSERILLNLRLHVPVKVKIWDVFLDSPLCELVYRNFDLSCVVLQSFLVKLMSTVISVVSPLRPSFPPCLFLCHYFLFYSDFSFLFYLYIF